MGSFCIGLARTGIAFAVLSSATLAAQAATIQVAANSNYFNGWQFNTSTSPGTGCGTENTPATTTFGVRLVQEPSSSQLMRLLCLSNGRTARHGTILEEGCLRESVLRRA